MSISKNGSSLNLYSIVKFILVVYNVDTAPSLFPIYEAII